MFRSFFSSRSNKNDEENGRRFRDRSLTEQEQAVASILMNPSGGREADVAIAEETKKGKRSKEELMRKVEIIVGDLVKEYGKDAVSKSFMLVKGRIVDKLGYGSYSAIKHDLQYRLTEMIESSEKNDDSILAPEESFVAPPPPPRPRPHSSSVSTIRAFDSGIPLGPAKAEKTKTRAGIAEESSVVRFVREHGQTMDSILEGKSSDTFSHNELPARHTHAMITVRNPPTYAGPRTMTLPCAMNPETGELGIILKSKTLIIKEASSWAKNLGFRPHQRILKINGRRVFHEEEAYWAIKVPKVNTSTTTRAGKRGKEENDVGVPPPPTKLRGFEGEKDETVSKVPSIERIVSSSDASTAPRTSKSPASAPKRVLSVQRIRGDRGRPSYADFGSALPSDLVEPESFERPSFAGDRVQVSADLNTAPARVKSLRATRKRARPSIVIRSSSAPSELRRRAQLERPVSPETRHDIPSAATTTRSTIDSPDDHLEAKTIGLPPGITVEQNASGSNSDADSPRRKPLRVHPHDDITHTGGSIRVRNQRMTLGIGNMHAMQMSGGGVDNDDEKDMREANETARSITTNDDTVANVPRRSEIDDILRALEHAVEFRDEIGLSRALRDAALLEMNARSLEIAKARAVLMDLKLCRNLKNAKMSGENMQSVKVQKMRAILQDVRAKQRHIEMRIDAETQLTPLSAAVTTGQTSLVRRKSSASPRARGAAKRSAIVPHDRRAPVASGESPIRHDHDASTASIDLARFDDSIVTRRLGDRKASRRAVVPKHRIEDVAEKISDFERIPSAANMSATEKTTFERRLGDRKLSRHDATSKQDVADAMEKVADVASYEDVRRIEDADDLFAATVAAATRTMHRLSEATSADDPSLWLTPSLHAAVSRAKASGASHSSSAVGHTNGSNTRSIDARLRQRESEIRRVAFEESRRRRDARSLALHNRAKERYNATRRMLSIEKRYANSASSASLRSKQRDAIVSHLVRESKRSNDDGKAAASRRAVTVRRSEITFDARNVRVDTLLSKAQRTETLAPAAPFYSLRESDVIVKAGRSRARSVDDGLVASMTPMVVLRQLWRVFSFYSALHVPSDLDHIADTAVFRFLSDTHMIKRGGSGCPPARAQTEQRHRSMSVADAQMLVHALRMGRRVRRRQRRREEKLESKRATRSEKSNLMFSDFVRLIDCLDTRKCPAGLYSSCALCALNRRGVYVGMEEQLDRNKDEDVVYLLTRSAHEGTTRGLSDAGRTRLEKFSAYVEHFVLPDARMRHPLDARLLLSEGVLGADPAADGVGHPRMRDATTLGVEQSTVAESVCRALGRPVARAFRDLFQEFLVFKSDWFSVLESGGYAIDTNAMRRRHVKRLYWPQFLDLCECCGLEHHGLPVRDLAESFLATSTISFPVARSATTQSKGRENRLMVHSVSVTGCFAALLRLSIAFDARRTLGRSFNVLVEPQRLAECARRARDVPIFERLEPMLTFMYLSLVQSRKKHQNSGFHWTRLSPQRQALLSKFVKCLGARLGMA